MGVKCDDLLIIMFRKRTCINLIECSQGRQNILLVSFLFRVHGCRPNRSAIAVLMLVKYNSQTGENTRQTDGVLLKHLNSNSDTHREE